MALVKTLTLPSGVVATYLRIDSLTYDRAQKFVQINVSAYLDADHATNGAAPVAQVQPVVIEGEAAEILLAALHDAAGALAYETLRENPNFADAQNA